MQVKNLGTFTEVSVGSPEFNLKGYLDKYWGIQLVLTGDPLSGVVAIEGSLNGADWVALDTHTLSGGELSAMGAIYYITDKPVRYVRANVTTLTATTSATVEVLVLYGN